MIASALASSSDGVSPETLVSQKFDAALAHVSSSEVKVPEWPEDEPSQEMETL